MNVQYWRTFLAKNPTVTSALMGGAIGGGVGGVLSDPGAEGRGVAQGAMLGGIAGSLGGKTLHSIAKRAPSPEGSLSVGAIAGGTLGGYLGKRQVSPWMVQHLRQQGYDKKEASVSQPTELEKKAAMEKEAELNNAFDFGMNTYFKQMGIDRAALIKAANQAGAKVDDASLAEATIQWVSELQEKK